ncbi:hypothetical protein PENTCL1PPCAC_20719, partial [Pristionchus entomophagus]
DSWTPIKRMGLRRTAATAALFNGKIYAVGGSALDRLERYDPKSDTWTTLSSMKISRYCAHLAASCGKLFVFAG